MSFVVGDFFLYSVIVVVIIIFIILINFLYFCIFEFNILVINFLIWFKCFIFLLNKVVKMVGFCLRNFFNMLYVEFYFVL